LTIGIRRAESENTIREVPLVRLMIMPAWQSDIIGQSSQPRGAFFGQQGMSSAIPSVAIVSIVATAGAVGIAIMAAAERVTGAAMRPHTASTLRTRNMVSLMLTISAYHTYES
jgi:hypothetical protein